MADYGHNEDGTLREGVIYLDPADGEIKSVQEGHRIMHISGDPFNAVYPTEDLFLDLDES